MLLFIDKINDKTIMLNKQLLTPPQIVAALDQYIIGQQAAKKAVAIALRNRWRRKQIDKDLQQEIYPRNILMVGPTGVGKTEIARRLAKLVDAPFIKVEATKFTEVGYVGRDVDSIVRDLLDNAIMMNRNKAIKEVEEHAIKAAHERVLVALVGAEAAAETKEHFMDKILSGALDNTEIEIEMQDNPNPPMIDMFNGSQMGMINVGDMLMRTLGNTKMKKVKTTVQRAVADITKEEAEKLLDEDKIIKDAIHKVEQDGIVFLDEIDKICARGHGRGEVSREGVQRDLLPLIEGTTISTKHGPINTDHILFIASGAFHLAKPSDLLPELQGRLPIRVDLQPLTQEDFIAVLTEPKASLLKQATWMFAVESIELSFTDDAVAEIARLAYHMNSEVENIGARRLHAIMEKLLENLNYQASDMLPQQLVIDKTYVTEQMQHLLAAHDLAKFVL